MDGSDKIAPGHYSETVRLPRRVLRWWIGLNVVVSLFLAWLWAIADMTVAQQIGTGLFLLLVLSYLWLGALWFVASHLVVDGHTLSRRVGHRRTRTALSDITGTRVKAGAGPEYTVVVVTLRDGNEREFTTRHPDELIAAIQRTET